MIKCIAIDDEPIALTQITSYIRKTPFLECVASFENSMDALRYLDSHNDIDVMFVDIQMPDMSGMDLVKSLVDRPEVVFTTASSAHAVEGFQVSALDYILKPIDYASFLKSANKVKAHFDLLKGRPDTFSANARHLFLKSDYKIVRIEIHNILYIEGMREYVRIHIDHGAPIMSLLSMKNIEQRLPGSSFMRVHRSYIVNLEKITMIERNRIIFNKEYIPVGDQYKDAFQKYLDEHFLL